MNVEEIMAQAKDTMTVKRVFGEPYEKDGVTVIPAAAIGGGAGGGEGRSSGLGALRGDGRRGSATRRRATWGGRGAWYPGAWACPPRELWSGFVTSTLPRVRPFPYALAQ
jgi:hypothetical protein